MPQVKELCEKSAKAGLGDGAETRRRGLTQLVVGMVMSHDPSFPKGQLEKPIRHVPKSEPYWIFWGNLSQMLFDGVEKQEVVFWFVHGWDIFLILFS